MEDKDIIAAIATAPGNGAIGIVRVSGGGVGLLVKSIFRGASQLKSHQMYYGKIISGGSVVDEVMLCFMQAPRTYTMEDTVEIFAHGGRFVLSSVLDAVLEAGARLAHPGEFTKRAFLNGRINLTQAEGVMDVINAETAAAQRIGLSKLGGGLSLRIEEIRTKILSWIAHIELSIDYPEHEEEAKNLAEILAESGEIIAKLEALISTSNTGRIITEGVRTAIIGRPNAGKSTLLNAILSEDRAIVHEEAGTTRDVLTERVVVGNVPLLLMDTAGIRDTDNFVEKIGVEKSLNAAKDAELVLYLIDSTVGLMPEDETIVKTLAGKPVIKIFTKADIVEKNEAHCVSAVTGQGLQELYTKIENVCLAGIGDTVDETEIITRKRHRLLLEEALQHVKNAVDAIQAYIMEDLVSIELRGAYLALGHILGMEVADDILDRIFAEFCLGK